MTLGTHVAFASVLYLGGATLFGYRPDWIGWLIAAAASLLPVPLALAQCTRARTARRVLTALSALASLGYLIAFALRWQVW